MKTNATALQEGDIISVDGDKLTVELPAGESDRNFGTLSTTILELKGNNFSKGITGSVKGLILTGASLYDISGMTIGTEGLILADTVKVNTITNAQKLTLAANAQPTINGLKITTTLETVMTVNYGNTAGHILVEPNNASNNLTFENTNANGDVDITLNGASDYTSSQDGSIKIVAKGGKVKVTGSNMKVDSNLEIEVTGGIVEIQGETLKGKSKKVKVSGNATVTAKAATKAPYTLEDFEMKEYSLDDTTDVATLTTAGVITGSESEAEQQAKVDKLNAYLSSFGVNGIGAQITVTRNADENVIEDVKIVFSADTENEDVLNIQ